MSVNEEALRTAVKSITKFSAKYFKILSDDNANKNIICSPFSTSVVLSMITYGARGRTEDQLRSALYLTNDNITKNGFQSLIDSLNNFKRIELRLANKIFTASEFELKEDFKDISETTFRSALDSIDFKKPQEASKIINQWCEDKTNNRIKDMVDSDDLKDAALVLINAVYFKGNWAEKFDPALTTLCPFHIDEKTIKQVPMMCKDGKFNYGRIDELNSQFVELPYESNTSQDAISMFIILPDESHGLKNIESNLDKINFGKLRNPAHKIYLQIPKFKIESKFDLNEILKQIGIKEVFENTANFSGISDTAALKVSKVVQKAFIEVNEEGSEAAAVTGIQMMLMCMPLTVVIDRPFICVVVAHHTGTQLFSARVIDPTLN